jgi:hypothetical protein
LLANNNPAEVARLLGVSGLNGGLPGSLLRNAGLPENFVLVNPQFTTMFFVTNQGNSSYHSLQAEVVKRFAQGWTLQGNYTWSKALGDNEGDEAGYRGFNRTLRNASFDRRRMSFDRRHVVRLNGIWELPFGPGKSFAKKERPDRTPDRRLADRRHWRHLHRLSDKSHCGQCVQCADG